MRKIKMLLEYDLGEFDEDYLESIKDSKILKNYSDKVVNDEMNKDLGTWYDYLWQCDFDLNHVIIKGVKIYDAELED